MLIISEFIFLIAALALFIFILVLGERFRLNLQRGWYVVVSGFGLLFAGGLIEFLDSFFPASSGHWLSSPFIQIGLKLFGGQALSLSLLLLGVMLWGPAVAASREKHMLRIRDSERRYRRLTENASDMLSEHELDGRYIFVTPASFPITGYLPEELVGRSLYEFIDPNQLEFIQEQHSRVLEAGEQIQVTYAFRHRLGHFIWLESSTSLYKPEKEEGETRMLAISRDITERVKNQDDLKRLNVSLDEQQHRVRLLYELSASSSLSEEEQFQATLKSGVDNLGMDHGIISKVTGDEYKVLHFYPASSGSEKGQISELGDTYSSIALRTNDILSIDEMKTSEYASHPCYKAFNLESYIGVPLTVNSEPFGTLSFSKLSAREKQFSDSDRDFVRLMGQWVCRVLEQERALKELQQSEEKFRVLVRSAIVGVITMDTLGNVESFNESAQRIFGFSRDEIVGQNIKMLMGPPEYDEHGGYLKDYAEGRPLKAMGESREVVGRRKDGRKVYLDLGVTEIKTESTHFFTGMIRDITQQKEAEDNLANAHLQLKSVFDSATQVAIIATNLDGDITVFNSGAERMLGYSSKEAIGKSSDIFHVESEVDQRATELSEQLGYDVAGVDTYVALAKLGGVAEREWTYVRKDGSTLLVDSTVTATHDTSGMNTGYLGVIMDITERKRAEESLLLAKSVAETANQTKSEFLANMSHELRTPLNSVIGFSNILLRNPDSKLNTKDITYLERILANGKHLLGLINDILDLSKIEAGRVDLDIVTLNVGVLIRDLLAQVESQVSEKQVSLDFDVPKNLMDINTDPGKLKQVLLNLISNAIKFTEKGSVSVNIRTDKKTHRPISLDVIDTGIGIPPERLEHIFDEFEQVDSSTHRKYGGTGLGLSISRALCELMGYSLNVNSEINKGSTFTISIPLEDSQVKAKADEPARIGSRSSDRLFSHSFKETLKGKRILLVDDDPDSLTLLTHYLKETGCELESADAGSKALAAIKRKKPDLITLDLQMPTMSGEHFLAALQAEPDYQNIPVIVVSIMAAEYRGKLQGVNDYIQKPVNQHDLIWAINRNLFQAPCCVLLVEDDPDMREVISVYLSDFQLELRTAANGREALDVLDKYTPELILLDLRMPEMDGLKFLARLKRKNISPEPQIVIITGKLISPEENLQLKNDQIIVINKDQNFEKELRHQVSRIFMEKRSVG